MAYRSHGGSAEGGEKSKRLGFFFILLKSSLKYIKEV